jgi:hypothetical protein
MPYVLGRRVAPTPGTTLRLDIDGDLGRTVQLAVGIGDDGAVRARAIPVIEGAPSASLWMDEATFVRRACGRLSAAAVLSSSGYAAGGDVELATAFVEQMVVLL